MEKRLNLSGKNIVLTGASHGFGRYLAQRLWEQGANLLLVARNELQMLSLMDTLRPAVHQIVWCVKADLADPAAVSRIIFSARARWSRLDGLVNNAAVQGPVGPSWETKWEDWQYTFWVDLLAPIDLCRAFVPWMLQTGGGSPLITVKGKIVNLSGGGAGNPRPGFAAYATAKTGLVRFSECLAAELAGKGIDVNCVAPGAMPTGMHHQGDPGLPNVSGDYMEKPAKLISFLLSSESDGITGRLISAVWDDWEKLGKVGIEADSYTLRRVVPKETI